MKIKNINRSLHVAFVRKALIAGYCILGCAMASVYAQDNTVAAGGEATGSGGTLSFSVGQTDYITASGSEGTITQGVQQPYEIFVLTGIEETGIDLEALVYPNPFAKAVVIKITHSEISQMTYTVYDERGRLVEKNAITDSETTVNMSEHADAAYFIRVTKNNRLLKSFKIIKTQN